MDRICLAPFCSGSCRRTPARRSEKSRQGQGPASERRFCTYQTRGTDYALQLFGYWRSSRYQVRIVMQLKGARLREQHRSICGREQRGKALSPDQPQGWVPVSGGRRGAGRPVGGPSWSLDRGPTPPPRMPSAPRSRAGAPDSQHDRPRHPPLNNLRVLNYLEEVFQAGKQSGNQRYRHWIGKDLQRPEQLLMTTAGRSLRRQRG